MELANHAVRQTAQLAARPLDYTQRHLVSAARRIQHKRRKLRAKRVAIFAKSFDQVGEAACPDGSRKIRAEARGWPAHGPLRIDRMDGFENDLRCSAVLAHAQALPCHHALPPLGVPAPAV